MIFFHFIDETISCIVSNNEIQIHKKHKAEQKQIQVKRTFVIRFQSVELYDRCLEGSVAYETNISGSDP